MGSPVATLGSKFPFHGGSASANPGIVLCRLYNPEIAGSFVNYKSIKVAMANPVKWLRSQ